MTDASNSGHVPSGTVTFKDAGNVLSTGNLLPAGPNAAQASLPLGLVNAGSHSITAEYAGDTYFASNTSSAYSETVNKASTSVGVSSSGATVVGQTATFTINVTSSADTPSGTVTVNFGDGSGNATVTLSGGSASATHAYATIGAYTVTATYLGDTNFSGSSNTTSQTVNAADTTTTLGTSGASVGFGTSITFTATVAATSPATGTPTGTVTFKDNTTSTTLGTGTLNGSGQATLHHGRACRRQPYHRGRLRHRRQLQRLRAARPRRRSTKPAPPRRSPRARTRASLATASLSLAEVSAATGGVPSGTVTFKDGANTIGTTRLNTGAIAAVGDLHTCAITVAGGVECWGYNSNGQLGDGTASFGSSTPVAVPGLSGVVGLAAGNRFTCALLNDGTAKCWGLNDKGQLGNNSTTESHSPVQVLDPAGGTALSGIVALTAGAKHACALLDTGAVDCWGFNGNGQLGNNTTTDSHLPVQVLDTSGSAPLTNVTAIAAGASHECAVLNDGTALCWGWNQYGQLGNGTTVDSAVPVAVSGLTGATGLAAAAGHTCALLSNGGAKCWGYNGTAALGINDLVDSHIPVDVRGLSNAVGLIAGGGEYSCAMLASGGVKCWGLSGYGLLGQGNGVEIALPVDVPGLSGVVALATGGVGYHACAVLSSGALQCWGFDSAGQLGNGTTDANGAHPTPATVIGLGDGTTLQSAQAWYLDRGPDGRRPCHCGELRR